LRAGRFCNVHRENDRVSRQIAAGLVQPFGDVEDLWFGVTLARCTNEPGTLSEIEKWVPFDSDYLRSLLEARQKRGDKVFRSDAYKPPTPPNKDDNTIRFLIDDVLAPMWANRETLRPRAEDTLASYSDRLRTCYRIGPFLAGQIIADLKHAQLKDAADWWTFAVPGPGSERGLNRVCGRSLKASWSEPVWLATLLKLRDEIAPALAAANIAPLDAQNMQNVLCEFDKYERARDKGGVPARKYKKPRSHSEEPAKPAPAAAEPAVSGTNIPTPATKPAPATVEPAVSDANIPDYLLAVGAEEAAAAEATAESEAEAAEAAEETASTKANGAGSYPHGEQRGGQRLATYIYKNHLGQFYLLVEKLSSLPGKKRPQFPQYHWTGSRWEKGKPDGPKIPYRLPELLAAQAAASTPVHIPEGENDADTLAALGLIATTNSEGAKKGSWTPELNRWFHGVPQVFIPEDNDEPGRAFAREKARALAPIVPDIRIVSFPDVPEGQDVSYWLQELKHSKEDYLARCAEAPIWRDGELQSVRASTIEMTDLEWLWPNRFALGKIGIIAGLPDEGKGLLLSNMAACCTNPALAWPNEEGPAPQGNVILLTAEDDPADTVLPRLAAAGADLSRVELIQLVREHDSKTGEQRDRMFSLVHDLAKLRAKIAAVGSVVLVVIDPISAYLGIGEIDSFRDADVRAVLGPLKELAGETRATVLAVMHFNKKVDVLNMMLRICNSIAFAAASRHAFGVIDDPDNHRKLFVRGKNNLGQRDDRSLAFRFSGPRGRRQQAQRQADPGALYHLGSRLRRRDGDGSLASRD
jgi:hypothetical protein